MEGLRFRQVHLDFHTSEHIAGIGAEFDSTQFRKALVRGHVDSVTLFSKCHHGWSYHPTKINEMHPNLNFDLLGEQLKVCEELGIKAPVYLSAGLDEKEAVRHPEWLVRREDDSTDAPADFVSKPGYHTLCFRSDYLELLLAEIEEVMQRYHPCGIFLDISAVRPCYCHNCRRDILARGKDPRDIVAVMEQAEFVYENYAGKVREMVRKYSKTCTVFHNGGHISRGRRDIAFYNTHLELESLPTGGWGYDHFPMSASYAANLGMEYLGMTGKFHSSWGEFGGFKHPNALRFESSLSLAMGAKCSIGDQLHPSGRMDMATYDLIGTAYSEVEEKEKWCKDAVPCADVAVLSEEAVNCNAADRDMKFWGDIGANRALLEGNYLYSFIDCEEDFSKYRLLILPDTIRLDEVLNEKLTAYLNQGGKLFASGRSGLYQDADVFALDFGADFDGAVENKPGYVLWGPPNEEIAARVMYEQGYQLANVKGEVIVERQNSYFNRDIRHFCSHQHTPNNPSEKYPAGIATEKTIYIGWDLFSDYGKRGSLHSKQLIVKAINMLLGENRTLEVSLPDRGIVTLAKQISDHRYVSHLLFSYTSIRGEGHIGEGAYPMEVIEDIVPLYNVEMKVNLPEKITDVYLAPQGQSIPYSRADGGISFIVPEVNCHQMVVLDYESDKI
ncbi:hypothetical protein K040078D81_06990 [Blautia hominis]|uniref:Beta-galactosidase trimerisation domain-containing protein n=1 Tax=Blautia hominis TaxID=2025493 RepID=A0ABQ0B556_9FIRM